MINKKIITIVALIAMIASVIGGYIVYAALSSTLTISGTAEFQPESWAVRFKASTLSSAILTGGATVSVEPTLSDTLVGDFKVVLTQPGDSAAYKFYIENTGSLDAVLSTYNSETIACAGTGATASADEGIVCSSNLTYTLKYVGGDLAGNNLTSDSNVAQGDLLKAGTSVQVELKISYSSSATQLPADTVTITGLGKSLIYTAS